MHVCSRFQKTNGSVRKAKATIVREYELSPSALDCWIKEAQTSGSVEENELIALRKRVQRLEMKNDISKQAALITGSDNSECVET